MGSVGGKPNIDGGIFMGKFFRIISFNIGGGGGKRDPPHQVYRWDNHNPIPKVMMRIPHAAHDHVIYDIHFMLSMSRIIIPNTRFTYH